ncbi:uncharacterized protein G2W53_027331 [Senna tora]|uniref:Uncharacterized protein n=1 Tax=Senna tora TaxID=362788 RepID=A0A834TJ83_9FABA|nr:uncharacterized protein G2W53_027331 [Senna tora]
MRPSPINILKLPHNSLNPSPVLQFDGVQDSTPYFHESAVAQRYHSQSPSYEKTLVDVIGVLTNIGDVIQSSKDDVSSKRATIEIEDKA